MDIQRWFAIESPKEMSEAFAKISALYYIAQVGAHGAAGGRAIERHLDYIRDQSEWFAACMCLETVLMDTLGEVRWSRAS